MKGVIVKQIKEDNIELPMKESIKKLTEYYQKLFIKNRTYKTPWNSIFCYDINLDEAIQKLAKNKATGEDHNTSEWIIGIMEN